MVYTPAPIYRVLGLVSGIAACLLIWQLAQRFDWGALIFLGVMLWITVRLGRMAAGRVEVAADRVRYVPPYGRAQEVEFRQMRDVYAEGRGFQSILVAYYPRLPNGLLDLDDIKHLALPAVRDHAGLFATLTTHIQR
jgi:hypothetical protein